MADPYFDLDTHPETNVTSAMYAFFGDAAQIERGHGTMCVRTARARAFSLLLETRARLARAPRRRRRTTASASSKKSSTKGPCGSRG